MPSQGRPPATIRNLDYLKPLWQKARQQFETGIDLSLNPIRKVYFDEMSKATKIGWSVLDRLDREIEKGVKGIKVSDKTMRLLNTYLDPSFSPEPGKENPFSSYFGTYACYYKMDKLPFIRMAKLEIGDKYLVFEKEGDRYEGKNPEIRSGNLYLTVSSEKRIFHFVCHVGVASRENLGAIPGFLTGINSAALPLFLAILLVRSDSEQKPDVESFFRKYGKATVLRGWDINQIFEIFDPVPSRISGLFGNWYIYHLEANGDIRRGKIKIEDENMLEYIGTAHHFEKGSLQIADNTHIAIQLIKSDSTKLLYLIGRIGDASNLSTLKKVKCVFASTGKGGTVLKAGFCVMVREYKLSFPDMTSAILERNSIEIKALESDGLSKFLSKNHDIEE